jgi:hypothetical protein
MTHTEKNLLVNIGLLVTGFMMIFSGVLIQVNYHMGNHGNIESSDLVLGVNYPGWSYIHKASVVITTLLMVFHFIFHWKWYKTVFSKHLIRKNRQQIILTVLFLIVAVTGYVPWIISLTGGNAFARKVVIEIHDKLALVVVVYLSIHVIQRINWYAKTVRMLKSIHR